MLVGWFTVSRLLSVAVIKAKIKWLCVVRTVYSEVFISHYYYIDIHNTIQYNTQRNTQEIIALKAKLPFAMYFIVFLHIIYIFKLFPAERQFCWNKKELI